MSAEKTSDGAKIPMALFFSEFAGTALLIALGLSVVILDFGAGSPMLELLPSAGARRLLTGFLFGSIGALIAISPIGKASGAHINPVVTLAFWVKRKMNTGHAAGYIVAQLAGAIVGALPLMAWERMGSSVQYGATFPGQGYSALAAMTGEAATTFALIVGLFLFIGHRRARPYTPLLFPFLYALMVWQAWWVYWVGPLFGTLIAVGAHSYTWLKRFEFEVAKLYHFDHDPHGVFRRRSASARIS